MFLDEEALDSLKGVVARYLPLQLWEARPGEIDVLAREDMSDPIAAGGGGGRDGLEPAPAPRFGCRSRCPV